MSEEEQEAQGTETRGLDSGFEAAELAPAPLVFKEGDSLGFVMDVPVRLTVEIGRKAMRIGELLKLGPGAILELNKANGDPLEVYANDRLVARGEAVVVGERYGVRLTEVLVNEEAQRDEIEELI